MWSTMSWTLRLMLDAEQAAALVLACWCGALPCCCCPALRRCCAAPCWCCVTVCAVCACVCALCHPGLTPLSTQRTPLSPSFQPLSTQALLAAADAHPGGQAGRAPLGRPWQRRDRRHHRRRRWRRRRRSRRRELNRAPMGARRARARQRRDRRHHRHRRWRRRCRSRRRELNRRRRWNILVCFSRPLLPLCLFIIPFAHTLLLSWTNLYMSFCVMMRCRSSVVACRAGDPPQLPHGGHHSLCCSCKDHSMEHLLLTALFFLRPAAPLLTRSCSPLLPPVACSPNQVSPLPPPKRPPTHCSSCVFAFHKEWLRRAITCPCQTHLCGRLPPPPNCASLARPHSRRLPPACPLSLCSFLASQTAQPACPLPLSRPLAASGPLPPTGHTAQPT